jgi:glycosyltransferase involved in cell wall biosynthesis
MRKTDRSLLFLSPVMPKPGGNGLAMRAASMLDALTRDFAVDLFVFPVAGPAEPPGSFVAQRVRRVGMADPVTFLDTKTRLALRFGSAEQRRATLADHDGPTLSLPCTEAAARHLADWAGPDNHAVIHAMRLYLAPLLRLFDGNAVLVLDLDDDDAAYQDGLAALCRAAGDADGAQQAAEEAQRYQMLGAAWMPRLALCLTAGTDDASRLGTDYPGTPIRAVPNAYLPLVPLPLPASKPDMIRLLFVGTLGYPPNADAATVLIRDVLPRLQRQIQVRLDVAGIGAPTALAALAAGNSSVVLHGFVEELAPLYAAADIVAAPLRFGAGTPIKLLEAFAHGRPVVATRFAAAGHAVVDGEHLLLADDADGFAAACLRLHREDGLGQRLVAAAGKRLRARHHPDRVGEALAAAYALLPTA